MSSSNFVLPTVTSTLPGICLAASPTYAAYDLQCSAHRPRACAAVATITVPGLQAVWAGQLGAVCGL